MHSILNDLMIAEKLTYHIKCEWGLWNPRKYKNRNAKEFGLVINFKCFCLLLRQ